MFHGARALRWVACVLVLAGLVADGAQPIRAAWLRQPCTPLVQFHAGRTTCYPPSQIAIAERRLVPRPVRPAAIVARLTQVPLRQVIVLSGTPQGAPGLAIALIYVFGMPTYKSCPSANRCPAMPLYVVVQETVGHVALAVHGLQVATTGGFPGPWSVSANLPHRTLSLNVTSNASTQRIPVAIARSLVQAAA